MTMDTLLTMVVTTASASLHSAGNCPDLPMLISAASGTFEMGAPVAASRRFRDTIVAAQASTVVLVFQWPYGKPSAVLRRSVPRNGGH